MKMFFLRPGDRIRLLQDGLCDVTPERSVRTYITLPAGTILEVKRVKINKLEVNKRILPTWEWDEYLDEWEVAKTEWIGNLTLEALLSLMKFNRIEMR